jgi:hypothetical protein
MDALRNIVGTSFHGSLDSKLLLISVTDSVFSPFLVYAVTFWPKHHFLACQEIPLTKRMFADREWHCSGRTPLITFLLCIAL